MHKWSSSEKVISLQKTLHLLFYVSYQHEYFILNETAFSTLCTSQFSLGVSNKWASFLPSRCIIQVSCNKILCSPGTNVNYRWCFTNSSIFHSQPYCVLKSRNTNHLNFPTINTKSFDPRRSVISKGSMKLESRSWLSFILDPRDKRKVPGNDNCSKCH